MILLKTILLLLPWPLRRFFLQRLFGYELAASARIGFAWVYPKHLRLGPHARIDHFTVAIHLDTIDLGDHATIGRSNWITGFSSGSTTHFAHQTDRKPQLVVGAHSAITKHHHLDCTHEIRIGSFTTIAGYQTQLLTHSIDITANRQHSKPISIGDYCFVSTRCVVLGGAKLPHRSVLAAGAVLTKAFTESHSLYGGVPAHLIKTLPADAKYFHRVEGFVR